MIKNIASKIRSNKSLSIIKALIYFVILVFYMITTCYFESYISPYLHEYKYCVDNYTYVNCYNTKNDILSEISSIDKSEYVAYKLTYTDDSCIIEMSAGAEELGFPTMNLRFAKFNNDSNIDTNYAYVNNTNKNKVSSKITVGEDTFDIKDVIDIKYTSIGNPDEHYDYSTMPLIFVFNRDIEVESANYIVVKSIDLFDKYYSSEVTEDVSISSGAQLKNNWNKTFKNYRMLIELVNLSVFLFFTFSIINLFYMADRKNIYYDKIKFLIGASSFRVFIEEFIYELAFIIILIPLPIIVGLIYNLFVHTGILLFIKYGLLGFAELIVLALILTLKRIFKAKKL